MEHTFFKDGEYEAVGGFFIRSNIKEFFKALKEKGLVPVGLKVDDESFNLEVLVEKNQAFIDNFEKKANEKETKEQKEV